MSDAPEVIPQPGERWLMRHGGRCYAIPAALGRRLRDGECVDGLDEALATAERSDPAGGRTLWVGLPLVPGRWVARAALLLSGLASWQALGVLAAFGCSGYLVATVANSRAVGNISWWSLILCLLMAGIVHEFGHAAALTRGGARPGRIGFGLLLIFPVLFCDVTAVALLERRERLKVDLAGVVLHLAAGGVLAMAGLVLGRTTLTVASWGVLVAIVWSALPFLHTDGYWFLCDLLRLRVLEPALPKRATWRLRMALIGWRTGHMLFLVLVSMTLVGRGRWLFAHAQAWADSVHVAVYVPVFAIFVMIGYNLVQRFASLVWCTWLDCRNSTNR